MANFFLHPSFHAQEALIALENALNIANTVHRGFSKSTAEQHDNVKVNRPPTFAVQDGTDTTVQDVIRPSIQVNLDQFKKVHYRVTDQDLTYGGPGLVNNAIAPAAYALADFIEAALLELYTEIPWVVDATGAAVDITAAHQVLFDNKVPMAQESNIFGRYNGAMQKKLLDESKFTEHQGAGLEGVEAQRSANLRFKYGMNLAATQNIRTHATTAIVGASPETKAEYSPSATPNDDDNAFETIIVEDTTLTGTVKRGDTLVIAGNPQRYSVIADATAAANEVTLQIRPRLAQTYPINSAVTFDQTDNGKAQNLYYHRNCFALAMAPLSQMGAEVGRSMATVSNPDSGLSVRSVLWHDADGAGYVNARLDVLYGLRVLDPNLGVRSRL